VEKGLDGIRIHTRERGEDPGNEEDGTTAPRAVYVHAASASALHSGGNGQRRGLHGRETARGRWMKRRPF